MNKIEELDIDQVAEDICDFYREEGHTASFHYVKELVRDWSERKYGLYLKMGKRLRVSSTDIGSSELSERSNFDSLATEIVKNHRNKSVGDDLHRNIAFLVDNMRRHAISQPEIIDMIQKNEAMKNAKGLECFVSYITGVFSADFDDSYGWSNQARLTRQVGMVMKDMKSSFEENLEEEVKKDRPCAYTMERLETNIDRLKVLPEAFNIALSELKQGLERDKEEMEFVISIHPYDFVTASFNQHNWSSCYAPSGSFAKSSFALMTDCGTAITYVPSKRKLFQPYAVELNSKKLRAFLHFNNSLTMAFVSKTYPYSLKGYEEAIAQTLVENNVMSTTQVWDYSVQDMDMYYSNSIYADLDQVNEARLITETWDPRSEDPWETWEIGEDVGCMDCGDICSMSDEFEYGDDEALSAWACIDCELGPDAFTCPHCMERYSDDERADYDVEHTHCTHCEWDFQNGGYSDDPHSMDCDCDLCEHRRMIYDEEQEKREDMERELEEERQLEEERLENEKQLELQL